MLRALGKLFGIDDLTYSDLSLQNKRFSSSLPYRSADFGYNGCTESYLLSDGSICFIYECTPLIFADNSVYDSLANALKIPFPDNTIIQFSLYSDNNINRALEEYINLRKNNSNELFSVQAEKYTSYFQDAVNGLKQIAGNPVRNFRIFVSVKVPTKNEVSEYESWIREANEYKEYIRTFESILNTSAKLNPTVMDPDSFVKFLTEFFNPDKDKSEYSFDPHMTINEQVIYADTPIEVGHNYMKIGSRYMAAITPKKTPKDVNFLFSNNLTGLINSDKNMNSISQSSADDHSQIKGHFLYTLAVIRKDISMELDSKAKQVSLIKMNNTDPDSSYMPGLVKRKEEFRKMIAMRESGELFFKVMPVLFIFSDDKDKLSKLVNDQKTIWLNTLGMDSQREQDYLLPKLLVSALPGGLYGRDINNLKRDWILQTAAASRFIALNGGNRGNSYPYTLFVDRRGQIATFDFFNTAENRNFLVTGGSGGGKSFLMNYFVSSYLGAGVQVRIIDVGGSYEKACYMFDGTYIDISKENIVINFFENCKIHIGNEDEVGESTLDMLTSIISTMAYSRTDDRAGEYEKVLIETAIKECYKSKGGSMRIDDIAHFLYNIRSFYEEKDRAELESDKYASPISIAHFLAESLEKYTTKGEYGKYFNGKSNVDLSSPLVVIELQGLPDDLKKVIVLAFSSVISDEIYKGAQKPTIIVLDEAWQTLQENISAVKFVEGLSRKIRKHMGGLGIITQSVNDLSDKGALRHLGNVLLSQSSFHIILPDDRLKQCVKNGLLEMSDFQMKFFFDKLVGTKDVGFNFSEFLVASKNNYSAYRLVVDPYTYLVNSSDPLDKKYISFIADKHISTGDSKQEAILKAIKECEKLILDLGGVREFHHSVRDLFSKLGI